MKQKKNILKIALNLDLFLPDKGGEKGGRGGSRDDGGPDRTDSDWRRKEPGTTDTCE